MMDANTATIIAGTLGSVLAAIVGWVLTFFPSKFERVPRYHQINRDTRKATGGKWHGSFDQQLQGQHIDIPVDFTLTVSKKGRITGYVSFSYNKIDYKINVRGGFYLEHFLKLEYENENMAIRQFGSFVLELDDNADKLNGCFVGRGNINRSIISGPVNLNKVVEQ